MRWFAEPLLLGRYPTAPDLPVCEAIEPGDLETIAQPLDFLGINYYTRIWSSTSNPPVPAPHAQGTSDMGWENYPEGLTELLCGLKRDYPLPPVFITENGLANRDVVVDGKVDDQPRIEYMRTHLSALKAAIDAGVDVRGFFYWSLMDNFEWSSGYAKRFGLVHVDYQTQVRTPKESAHWYRRFIEQQRRA